MEDLENIERAIEAGAKRGACSTSTDRQVIADAIEHTRVCWVDALLGKKRVSDWGAWSFQVAANAAKRIGGVRAKRGEVGLDKAVRASESSGNRRVDARSRQSLRLRISSKKSLLIGRQCEVLLKLCEPEMSFHRAAKELAMDRTALRRSFKSGMERLKNR